jgi:hypothetical protein
MVLQTFSGDIPAFLITLSHSLPHQGGGGFYVSRKKLKIKPQAKLRAFR